MSAFDVAAEFDRQAAVLRAKGYPDLDLEPLRDPVLERATGLATPTRARVPFVIVVSPALVPPSQAITRTEFSGRPGFLSPDTADIDDFTTIDVVDVPAGDAYVAFDLDRGRETLGMRPDDALPLITAAGRSPLTAAEGIALITHHPLVLEKNNCFQLLASRCGDRRVPGIWISDRRPKLGFCWAGNLHTWLGAASCADRAGASSEKLSERM